MVLPLPAGRLQICREGPMISSDNRRGIIDMSVAMALFIANDALVKLVSASLPSLQLIFIRGAFATALMLAVCQASGALRRDAQTGTWPATQLLQKRVLIRATLDACASLVYLTALFHMPLGNATAINMATPLVITIMAVFLIQEQVSLSRWLAIAAGFGGVLLIVQPAAEGFNAWALLCLAGTVLHAARDLMTRVIPQSVPSLLITLSTVVAVSLFSGVLSLFQGWQAASPTQLALLAAAGVLLSGGYFLLIRAMRAGEMSLIAPFRYTGLLFALVLGWWFWGDVPNLMAFIGIALLVAAGLYMLMGQRGKPPAPPVSVLDAAAD
jgi:drug/metabolite transporter (DMT)-like permease